MAKVPTETQIAAAENYALGQMCVSIPTKYGGYGYTKWDPVNRKCLITEKGCQPGPTNFLSQYPADAGGHVIDFTQQKNSRYYNVWKYAPAELLVMKETSISKGRNVCSRGNPLVYQWCNFPKQRAATNVPGLTNIVPFSYGVQNGKETCNIPKSYCDTHAYNWNQQGLYCTKPAEFKVAGIFGLEDFAQVSAVNGVGFSVIGPLGMLIDAKLSEGTDGSTSKLSDSRLKDNIRIKVRDYAGPGMHLCTFTWKPWALEIYGKHGGDVGFIADTLPREWVVIDGHGYKQINVGLANKKIRDFYRDKI